MRPLRLAQLAAEAEGLRIRSSAQRTAIRVAMGVVGLVFILTAFAFVHVTAWYWLRLSYDWPQHGTAGAIAGADLVVAVLFFLLASRSRPSRAELEAKEVRQRAMAGIATTLATSTLVIPVLRVMWQEFRRLRR